MMMVMVALVMVMRLGRRRDRHQHRDCEQRRAEREQHLLHFRFSCKMQSVSAVPFSLFTACSGENAIHRTTEGTMNFYVG